MSRDTIEVRVDGYFAIMPEWVLDAPVSDRAKVLYCVLDRVANQQTRQGYKGRAALAERLGCSLSSLDRAVAELVSIGALAVEHRRDPDNPKVNLPNLYTVYRNPRSPVTPPLVTSDDTPLVTSDDTPLVTSDDTPLVTSDDQPNSQIHDSHTDTSVGQVEPEPPRSIPFLLVDRYRMLRYPDRAKVPQFQQQIGVAKNIAKDAAASGYAVADVLACMEWMHADPYWSGRGWTLFDVQREIAVFLQHGGQRRAGRSAGGSRDRPGNVEASWRNAQASVDLVRGRTGAERGRDCDDGL